MPVYGYFNAIFSQVMLVNVLLYDHYFYTKFPDFIKMLMILSDPLRVNISV